MRLWTDRLKINLKSRRMKGANQLFATLDTTTLDHATHRFVAALHSRSEYFLLNPFGKHIPH